MSALQPWKIRLWEGAVETVVLRRLNMLERTIRYERRIDDPTVSAPPGHVIEYGPAFHATLQEWERALDSEPNPPMLDKL